MNEPANTTELFNSEYEELFNSFQKHLKTEQTRRMYRATLSEFLKVTGKNNYFEATPKDGDRYLDYLEKKRKEGKLGEVTINDKMYRLRSFSSYALNARPNRFNNFAGTFTDPFYRMAPHNPYSREITLPDAKQVSDLMNEVMEEDFKCFFELLLYTGISLKEAISLTAGSVQPAHLKIHSLGYVRVVTVPKELLQKLLVLKKQHRSSECLFQNRLGKPYNARYVERHLALHSRLTIREIRVYALTSILAFGVDEETFSRYTGILRPPYYKRYQVAAKDMTPLLDYSHVM